MRAWCLQSLEDRAFAVSILAALVMLWIALATVYMGAQLPQVGFLFIGWGQSIVAGSTVPVALEEPAHSEFFFRRVFS
jgi:F0F1-type ATP synthase membrane subunit c/vacuolar-type H+-ATPase subunit K